mmetsp:Transcript_42445/g.59476  ORF Transcript_42445/g.59476 Transcript_42445/m.59476 type:complete len:332 (-) Transcript_42445:47-1042(-)
MFGDNLVSLEVTPQLTLSGKSIAGHWTSISCRQFGIVFDIGSLTMESPDCRVVCVSHGHTDHIAGLPAHARIRKMKKGEKPIYILPPVCVDPFTTLFRASHLLDCGASSREEEMSKEEEKEEEEGEEEKLFQRQKKKTKLPRDDSYKVPLSNPEPEKEYYKLLVAQHEKEIQVPKGRIVVPLKTTHTIESYGYCVIEKRKKLREEFIGLDSTQIRAALAAGKQISDVTTVPVLGFSGDTTIEGILQNSLFLECEVLIMECTGLCAQLTAEKVRERGHIHLSDLNRHAQQFANVQHLVLIHFSARYHRNEIIRLVKNSPFAKQFGGKISCFV